MGIFNKLFSAVDKIEDVKNAVEKMVNSVQKSDSFVSESKNISTSPTTTHSISQIYNTDDNYFSTLITQSNFPGYLITPNVHARTLDNSAHPSCYPISYMFSKDGQSILAVLVMNKNQYRSMTARGTYKVLDDKGIKYIRFFKGMENKSDYVINRIRENLI